MPKAAYDTAVLINMLTHGEIQTCNLSHCAIWYDTLHLRAPKSQLNLLHGTNKQKKSNGIRTKNKNQDAQKKQSSDKVCGVSPEARIKSMVGKICEKGRFWARTEREKEFLMVRVVSWQSEQEEASQRQREWNEVDGEN